MVLRPHKERIKLTRKFEKTRYKDTLNTEISKPRKEEVPFKSSSFNYRKTRGGRFPLGRDGRDEEIGSCKNTFSTCCLQ